MVEMRVIVFLFAVSLITSTFLPSVVAQKDTIIVNPVWTCPATPLAANQPQYPQLDANGNRLLVHVVDKNGNDVEVWCINNDHFELRISSTTGSKKLSDCVLINGNNYWAVNASNHFPRRADGGVLVPIGPQNYTRGGTMVVNVDEIIIANHTNWVRPVHRTITDAEGQLVENTDGPKDVHTYYDFRTGQAFRRDTTNHVENGRVIIDTYTPWRQLTLTDWEPSKTGYTYSVQFNPVFAQTASCEAITDQNFMDFFPYAASLQILDVTPQFDIGILILAIIIAAAILAAVVIRKRKTHP